MPVDSSTRGGNGSPVWLLRTNASVEARCLDAGLPGATPRFALPGCGDADGTASENGAAPVPILPDTAEALA